MTNTIQHNVTPREYMNHLVVLGMQWTVDAKPCWQQRAWVELAIIQYIWFKAYDAAIRGEPGTNGWSLGKYLQKEWITTK